ncbi:60S ribosomal protein L7-3-like [Telopea speciosissima]|uniref:60S ribosomal protein L7-3-like n=1 Tax=Telopea speciosissima TaxID=54955 RepID=UPI001CC5379B|nr:60S ribosomal protein L7-3-like [Telopea speciosissima]
MEVAFTEVEESDPTKESENKEFSLSPRRFAENIINYKQGGTEIVTYGYPNLKSVKELVYKKGCGNDNGQRVPRTDNNIIEQALGNYGIICIEDIVHEIATVGLHFKEVVNFLWPFKPNKPEEGLQGKKKLYKDGGDADNREDLVNELITKMN